MARTKTKGPKLPKGVIELARPRGGRAFRAAIRHKGVEVHLGLYPTADLAGFAHNIAARAIGRGATPPNEAPIGKGPSAETVRTITERVRARLGLDPGDRDQSPGPPTAEQLLTFFEVTVVGFWRQQVEHDHGDSSGQAVESAASRIIDAADLLFWERRRNWPTPGKAAIDLLGRRLDRAFRRSDLTREVLADDGDDPMRVAAWLATPDRWPSARGFAAEIRHLYAEFFEGEDDEPATWAEVLGLTPPFGVEEVRDAYRKRSKALHPDAGGSQTEFIRLNAAYEEANAYYRMRGEGV